MTPLAAYLLLFVAVGIGFIFVHLMAGKFIRPNNPDPSKSTIYECGEPTIGSAWIQFDLRFYVIALLFVIFDVEVAFFFPWAEVFGKANAVAAAPDAASPEYTTNIQQLLPPSAIQQGKVEENFAVNQRNAHYLAWMALGEVVVFFGVLLVGFAYLWKRGDLAWVRSMAAERAENEAATGPIPAASTSQTNGRPTTSQSLAGTGVHS
jgi:NADH-quinone oxidoreductase subunit A